MNEETVSHTEKVSASKPPVNTPYTERFCTPKQDNGTRQLVAKHLSSARNVVNLRIVQLQNATYKSLKPANREQVLAQLHELTAYQGMLNSLAGALENDDHSVCFQTYLSSVAHATSRISHYLHQDDHEDHQNINHQAAPVRLHENPTYMALEARERELAALLDIGYALQEQNKEVKAASNDFSRTVLTAAALEAESVETREKLRTEAKESLRAEVTEEYKSWAGGAVVDPEAIHKTAKARWALIKAKAAEIHGVAVQHWNSRDEKIAAMRSKIQTVYADMVQPHIDKWHATAKDHAETFKTSADQMNQFASGLNSVLESYPSTEVQSLEALHSRIDDLSSHCTECASSLTQTLNLVHEQHTKIVSAKEAVARALKGDVEGLKDAAKLLGQEAMEKLVGEMSPHHEEHVPGMDAVKSWLMQSVDDMKVILKPVMDVISKDSGIGGNAFTA